MGPGSAAHHVANSDALRSIRGTAASLSRDPLARNDESLFALEVRRPLVEEGVHAFAEILAHIGLEDQVLALFAG